MYGSDWEALPDVREWSGIYPGYPGVVGRPSQMSGNDRDALPGCLAVVGRPSRMSGSCRKTLPDVWEWSGGYPE